MQLKLQQDTKILQIRCVDGMECVLHKINIITSNVKAGIWPGYWPEFQRSQLAEFISNERIL